MKPLRVLVLIQEGLMPPPNTKPPKPSGSVPWETEYDVITALKTLGHEVTVLPLWDEIAPLRKTADELKPHIAFNLMEAFNNISLYDQHVVAYLELLRIPYTGCNPMGLTLARDKALCKKILSYHRIPVPEFTVFPKEQRIKLPQKMSFPIIVKSLIEESSLGISQASIVDNNEKLEERIEFIHRKINTDAIAETYIHGRELYVGVMGNKRLKVFPAWEIDLSNLPKDSAPIATYSVKWDLEYQKRHRIKWKAAELSKSLERQILKRSKRIYQALNLSGYARIDYRVSDEGKIYLIEANPNPNIGRVDEFAESAKFVGIEYEKLIQRILTLGMNH